MREEWNDLLKVTSITFRDMIWSIAVIINPEKVEQGEVCCNSIYGCVSLAEAPTKTMNDSYNQKEVRE